MLSSVKLTLATCYRSRLDKRTGESTTSTGLSPSGSWAGHSCQEKLCIMSTGTVATTTLRTSGSSVASVRT